MKKLVIFLMFLLASCTTTVTAIPTELTINPTATLKLAPTPTKLANVQPTTTDSSQVKYYEFFPSPDGKRVLRGIEAPDANSFDIMKDGKVEWRLSYSNPELINAEYSPFFWSKDGKYLYLIIRQSMDGGFGAFYSGSGISRFELETGNITEVIPAGGMLAFAISPDENQIAYIREYENPIVLKVYDLNSHVEKELLVFDNKYAQIGCIGWSPKMDKLVFMTLEIKNAQTSDYSFGLSILNLGNLKMNSLIEDFDRWLSFESWNDESQVLYTDWQGTVWQLNLKSKTLSPIGQATPSP